MNIPILLLLWILTVSVQEKPADSIPVVDRSKLIIESQLMELNRATLEDREKEIEFIELKQELDSITKPQ